MSEPSAALRSLIGSRHRAEFALDRGLVDPEARTVELSFASEKPVARAWGVEVLDLSPRAVRMGRMADGAPLLVNHNPDDVVGVIDSARVDGDRRARAVARFGRSARAAEILQDVNDGIRRKVSVGYLIHDAVAENRKDGVETYRITDWEPFEVSLVSIPADASVGVGRSAERSLEGEPAMAEQQQQTGGTTATEAPQPSAVRDLLTQERTIREQANREMAKRNGDIAALGEKFARWGAKDLAARAVLDPTMTFESFREQVLSLVEQRQTQSEAISQVPADPTSIGAPASSARWGMGARDMLHATSLHAFRGIGKLMNKEDAEVAYRAGMWARAVIFGDPQAMRWCRDHSVQLQQGSNDLFPGEKRVMTEGIFTSAGWLVPVEMESAIIINREQYGVARRICNVIPMSTAATTIPRVTADVSAYFVGEGTGGTQSDSAGDQVNLNLKDLMCYTQVGKSTAMDSVIPLAEMVAREQARAFSIKEDACLFIGDGTSTYGGIQGINTLIETAAYAGGRATTATNHDTFGEIDVSDIATVIGTLPVYARTGARFVCSGVFEALVFGRLKLSAGGQDTSSLQGGVIEQSYAGFPVTVAHHMPAGAATDYTSKSMALLGNFQLGVAFGSGSGMMLTVDPYTSAHLNLTRIITTERIDINAHGVNKSTTVAGPIVAVYGNS